MRVTLLSIALCAAPSVALAQTQEIYPTPPPLTQQPAQDPYAAGYQQPPPGYVVQYAVPQGYAVPYARRRPRYIPYEEGTPVPPGARVVTRPRVGLIAGGAGTLGGMWLLSSLIGAVIVDAGSRDESGYWMMIPVVGPFAFAAATDDLPGVGWFGLTMLGVAQVAGATMLVVGLANPGRYLAYDGVARARPRWNLSPGAPGGYGATFSLSF